MKLSKEELKAKINEKITDENVKIELLEDIEDSYENDNNETVSKDEYEKVLAERDEIREKYKSRFLGNVEDKKEETKEDEEKETIDVKEIFEEKEGE